MCGSCRNETVVIGYEESEVLKVKRAEYYVEGDQAGEAGLQAKAV